MDAILLIVVVLCWFGIGPVIGSSNLDDSSSEKTYAEGYEYEDANIDHQERIDKTKHQKNFGTSCTTLYRASRAIKKSNKWPNGITPNIKHQIRSKNKKGSLRTQEKTWEQFNGHMAENWSF